MKTLLKRSFALLIALSLLFSLAACNKPKEPTNKPATSEDAFEKPEAYAAVLLLRINPQIKLYIGNDNSALAVEAVNDDAKQILDSVLAKAADFSEVIKSFVKAANSKGFIQEDAKIEIEIAELKDDKIDQNELLNKASLAASDAAAELEIALEVVLPSKEASDDKANADQTPDENAGAPEATDPPAPTQQNQNPPANNNGHTHRYSNATCTEPAKCSCGATNGAALGHSWQNATCIAPKTCKTCGATEGGTGDHAYANGVCSVCGASLYLNPKTNISSSEYVGKFRVDGTMLIGVGLLFEGDVCVVLDRFYNSAGEPGGNSVTYKGTVYHSEGAGQTPYNYEFTDSEIIIKGSLWAENHDGITMKLVLQANKMLKVTQSSNPQFPVGTILSTNIYDVL